MALFKLIGVPRTAGVPGFELLYDAEDPAKEALRASTLAQEQKADAGIQDSYGTKIAFNGEDFLFFILQDVALALDGKNAEQIAQLRAQARGQARVNADIELNTVAPSALRTSLMNGSAAGRG